MKKNPEKKDEIIKEIKDLFRIGRVPNYTKPVKYNKTADMEKEEENEGEKLPHELKLENYVITDKVDSSFYELVISYWALDTNGNLVYSGSRTFKNVPVYDIATVRPIIVVKTSSIRPNNSNMSGDMLYNLFNPALLNNQPPMMNDPNVQNQASAPKPDPFSNLMNLMK